MSVALTINGASETGAQLQALGLRLQRPDDLLTVLAREGNNRLRTHFRARNETPNKLGGRRTNFWAQIASSVSSRRGGPGQLIISITDPRFRQKVEGGPIRPKNAKALTIPVNPAAYGRTADVFQRETGIQLFLLKKKGGGVSNLLAGLVADHHFEVFYVLSGGVDQDADPHALPPKEEWQKALVGRAESYVARVTKNPKGGGSES